MFIMTPPVPYIMVSISPSLLDTMCESLRDVYMGTHVESFIQFNTHVFILFAVFSPQRFAVCCFVKIVVL